MNRSLGPVALVPAGTEVTIRTNEGVDSRDSDGRIFSGTLERDILDRDGRVAIPRGSQVELMARRVDRNEMVLDLESIAADGQRYSVVATGQDLSGGRLLLGLGVANKTIAAWHGGTFDRPLRRAREYIDIVRRTAASERVEYQGEIYSTGQRFQLSWKPSHPSFPIYLAGLGPQMTRLVGQISDGVFINMATPATIREIAGRVRAGAVEAGRDPDKIEIIAKVRVSLHPDRTMARSRLRQVLTFYNIADHYRDMLKASGFEQEVNAIQGAFKAGGFKAASALITDAYMDKLPVIPATSVKEIKERLQPFVEAGVHRLIVPYVPVTEPVIEDARRFVEAWGNS